MPSMASRVWIAKESLARCVVLCSIALTISTKPTPRLSLDKLCKLSGISQFSLLEVVADVTSESYSVFAARHLLEKYLHHVPGRGQKHKLHLPFHRFQILGFQRSQTSKLIVIEPMSPDPNESIAWT